MPLKVTLTRSEEDIEKDRVLFEREGFQIIALPLIEEEVLEFEVPDKEFHFVVFQSPRAVRAFLSRGRLGGEKVVVLGERTKKEVEGYGYRVWAMPENYYGEELVKLFGGVSGRVLIPKSAVGRDDVVEGLKALGLEVYAVNVYTVKSKLYRKEEILGKLSLTDVILFASPSAIRGLLANLQKEEAKRALSPIRVVCIGKTTREFLEREMSLECIVPEKPAIEKVVELLKSMA